MDQLMEHDNLTDVSTYDIKDPPPFRAKKISDYWV